MVDVNIKKNAIVGNNLIIFVELMNGTTNSEMHVIDVTSPCIGNLAISVELMLIKSSSKRFFRRHSNCNCLWNTNGSNLTSREKLIVKPPVLRFSLVCHPPDSHS